jgi:hypothetical protein
VALPSASVSERTIVAPESLAFAAASTLLFVSPVSGVSSERCPPHGRSAVGGEACPAIDGPAAIDGAAEFEPEPLAALATR